MVTIGLRCQRQTRRVGRDARWGGGGAGRGAGKSWRGGVLLDAVDVDQRPARREVRVVARLGEGQHRRGAGVGADEQLRPFVAGAGLEAVGEDLAQRFLAGGVELGGQVGGVELEDPQQFGVELRFDRADREELAVGGLVGVVERLAGVEQVRAALVGPQALPTEAPDHVRERERAVDHGGVDHLPLPRRLAFHEGGEDPEHEEHRAAAEVADHVQRRHRAVVGPSDRVQHTGQRDVVDVVAGRLGERSVLAPSGHPGVDKAGVACGDGVGPEPEALHDAGPEALDQHVGALEQAHHRLDVTRVLEVRLDDRAAALLRVGDPPLLGQQAGPLDADDVGTEVGEQQRGVRTGADTGELDDTDTREWTLLGGHDTPSIDGDGHPTITQISDR